MTNAEIKTLIKKAAGYARKRGYEQLADDFAQEAAIKAFATGFINLKWAFIDFLRKEYGDTRSSSGALRSISRRFGLSLDAPVGKEADGMLLHECIACPGGDPVPKRAAWHDRLAFTGRKAEIFEALIGEGDQMQELAFSEGVSPARISQEAKVVKKEMEKAIIWEEVMPDYKDDPEYSKLEIEWITL